MMKRRIVTEAEVLDIEIARPSRFADGSQEISFRVCMFRNGSLLGEWHIHATWHVLRPFSFSDADWEQKLLSRWGEALLSLLRPLLRAKEYEGDLPVTSDNVTALSLKPTLSAEEQELEIARILWRYAHDTGTNVVPEFLIVDSTEFDRPDLRRILNWFQSRGILERVPSEGESWAVTKAGIAELAWLKEHSQLPKVGPIGFGRG